MAPCWRHRTRQAIIAIVIATAAGCGESPARTTANFCAHYDKDKASYLARYNQEASTINGQKDGLTELLGTTVMDIQMIGSIERLFTDLASVAPDDISTDVDEIRDSLRKQEDALNGAANNPLGAFVSSLLGSLETSESWQNVSNFINENCET